MMECFLGARNWDHRQWVTSYYPLDLPSGWQLSFYANEYRTVLVSADKWCMASYNKAVQWDNDASESFQFFLELPKNSALLPFAFQFCDRLAGWPAGFVVNSPMSHSVVYRRALAKAMNKRSRNTPLILYKTNAFHLQKHLQFKGGLSNICLFRAMSFNGVIDDRSVLVLFSAASDMDTAKLNRVVEFLAYYLSDMSRCFLILEGQPPSVSVLERLNTLLELHGLS